jgi:hypothetical protein
VGEDCDKEINNLTDVFSGVTRYNWWSEVIKYPNTVQYIWTVEPKDVGCSCSKEPIC